MLLAISEVLRAETLMEARSLLSAVAWRDGAETAGATAKAVKRNLQADLSSRTGAALRDTLQTAIESNAVVRLAALPNRFTKLIVSKTTVGGGYGLHVDNAFMGADRLRTDLSFTLFLSDPNEYDGGELMIEQAGYSQSLKLPAGDLVLYPSTSLHEVRPVTRGERLVAVGWIESCVADTANREILFDLENLRMGLAKSFEPQSPEMLLLAKTIANLSRKFS